MIHCCTKMIQNSAVWCAVLGNNMIKCEPWNSTFISVFIGKNGPRGGKGNGLFTFILSFAPKDTSNLKHHSLEVLYLSLCHSLQMLSFSALSNLNGNFTRSHYKTFLIQLSPQLLKCRQPQTVSSLWYRPRVCLSRDWETNSSSFWPSRVPVGSLEDSL